MIKVTRKRQACMREDFLVRGIGKRAIHVVLPFDAMMTKPVSEILSEYELFWLIVETAQFVAKNYSWKCFTIKLPYLSYSIDNCFVYVRNCTRFEKGITDIKTLVDTEHFLNDNHFCPKYHHIPEYKGSKEPWQKKRLK